MTKPTMATQEGQLHVGRISAPDWQAAVEHLSRKPADSADDDMVIQWRSAGIVNKNLAVAPDWERAIDAQHRATVAITIVAQMGDMAFLTNLYLCPGLGDAVAVTLHVASNDTGQVDAVDPMAEVALAPMGRLWTMLRRAVPPLQPFQADPSTERGEPAPLDTDGDKVATAESAEASVFVFGVHAASGSSEEVIWYLSGGQLHRLSPATREVLMVSHGDVSSGLLALIENLLS